MLFDFHAFIEELRENEKKKEIVEKYEKYYGKITGEVKDQRYYKEYLINFKMLPYDVPEELKDEFDWKLLSQLIASSFSSECSLKVTKDKKLPTFNIVVAAGDQTVDKSVAELWSFQVLRLYEIYIEENMNLQTLMKYDGKEAQVILSQRQTRLEKWRKHVLVVQSELEMRDLLGEDEGD